MYMFYSGTKNRHGPSAQKTKVRVFMVVEHNKLPTGSILLTLTCFPSLRRKSNSA